VDPNPTPSTDTVSIDTILLSRILSPPLPHQSKTEFTLWLFPVSGQVKMYYVDQSPEPSEGAIYLGWVTLDIRS